MKPRLIHIGILTIYLPDVVYAVSWLAMDLAARLNIWPRAWDWVEIYAFIAIHPIWAEWIFFVAASLKFLAWILILLRKRIAIPVLATACGLGVLDWVLLSTNGYYSGGIESILQVIVELIALAGLFYLKRRNWLL